MMYISPNSNIQKVMRLKLCERVNETAFKRILVPTDFTENSKRAIDYAMNMAIRLDADVTLIHIISLFKEDIIKYYSIDSGEKNFTCQENRAMRELKMTCKAGKKMGVKMDFKLYTAPAVADAIIPITNQGDFDVVIMGSSGRTGLKRWFSGSVAEKVVHQSPIPVLVLHKKFIKNEIRKMLVPVDLSVKSPAVIQKVKKIAQEFKATIELIHVDEPAINPGLYLINPCIVLKAYPELKASKLKKMQKLAGILNTSATYTILPGRTHKKICEYAGENQFDLIVMSSQKKNSLKHFLIGSNTERVVRSAPCPVLSIKN